MFIKKPIIALHILTIVLFIGSRFIFRPSFDHSSVMTSVFTWREIFRYLLLVGFFYFQYYYCIPRLYFGKKTFLYVLYNIGCFIIISYLPNLLFWAFTPRPANLHNTSQNNTHAILNDIQYYLFDLQHSFYIFICVLFFSLVLAITSRLKKIASEKMETELSFLKAQVNPHFLFNSLNSIYSLSLSKSDKTADAVLKLSEMMRYVTDESKNDIVSLKKEINYINNYIQLQNMRMPDSTKLEYTTEIKNYDKQIASLILIHFIENSFKHGLSNEIPSTIQIDIFGTEDELSLYTANRKHKLTRINQQEDGIGLQNTINRLEYLYPNKHKLTINDTPTHYFVTLKMNLQ
jgi:sensor histidine kinase YesM